jgi:hypothetical protein
VSRATADVFVPPRKQGNITSRRQVGVSSKDIELLFQEYPLSFLFPRLNLLPFAFCRIRTQCTEFHKIPPAFSKSKQCPPALPPVENTPPTFPPPAAPPPRAPPPPGGRGPSCAGVARSRSKAGVLIACALNTPSATSSFLPCPPTRHTHTKAPPPHPPPPPQAIGGAFSGLEGVFSGLPSPSTALPPALVWNLTLLQDRVQFRI